MSCDGALERAQFCDTRVYRWELVNERCAIASPGAKAMELSGRLTHWHSEGDGSSHGIRSHILLRLAAGILVVMLPFQYDEAENPAKMARKVLQTN